MKKIPGVWTPQALALYTCRLEVAPTLAAFCVPADAAVKKQQEESNGAEA